MTKSAEATLGDISLNRLAVCECSDFNACFVCVCIIYSYNNEGTIGYRNSNTNIRRKKI